MFNKKPRMKMLLIATPVKSILVLKFAIFVVIDDNRGKSGTRTILLLSQCMKDNRQSGTGLKALQCYLILACFWEHVGQFMHSQTHQFLGRSQQMHYKLQYL